MNRRPAESLDMMAKSPESAAGHRSFLISPQNSYRCAASPLQSESPEKPLHFTSAPSPGMTNTRGAYRTLTTLVILYVKQSMCDFHQRDRCLGAAWARRGLTTPSCVRDGSDTLVSLPRLKPMARVLQNTNRWSITCQDLTQSGKWIKLHGC